MAARSLVESVQPWVTNSLESFPGRCQWLAGIIGDRPSQYAKSPLLWNAAFRVLGLDAYFLPLDVEVRHLASLVDALRKNPQVLGFSVTVPYKVVAMELLDEIDPMAQRIGAVNTVVRTDDGRLLGYNTDGQGFIDMVTKALPGQEEAFFSDLKGVRVLLIGSGGAARAVAFYLADKLGASGRLTIVARNLEKAQALAGAVNRVYANAGSGREEDIAALLGAVDFVINASSKGQQGIRRTPEGRITCLEPYSALGAAHPAELPEERFAGEASFYSSWYRDSLADIRSNLRVASELMLAVSQQTTFVDLIYAPRETVTLRLARLSGHRILNGRGMNIAQAADAFVNRVMRRHFAASAGQLDAVYEKVFRTMADVW
jgi:shikimate dehydrogenase